MAAESSAARVILDDKKARRVARQLQLPVTGTIAVIIEAKRRGLIVAMRPVLDELRAAGFWVSDALLQEALRLSGE